MATHPMATNRRSASVPLAYCAVPPSGTARNATERAGGKPALPKELSIRTRGHLPHWERQGGTYFVTFRLADSLPQAALHAFEAERDSIHRRAKQQGRELTASEGIRLEELYSEHVEGYLDSGAGACYLARPEIAELVAGALLHFNGKRYRLEAWCVMPNHVHVVFTVSRGESLKKILHSWKSYTAHKACEILGLSGEFWQREYYDHLVRNEQELARLVRYTESNPAKAHLSDWRWCSAAAPR